MKNLFKKIINKINFLDSSKMKKIYSNDDDIIFNFKLTKFRQITLTNIERQELEFCVKQINKILK